MTAMDDTTTTVRDPDAPAASTGRRPVNLTMDGDARDIPCAERKRLTDYPALAALRLIDKDLQELSHQGFVCREVRGNLAIFKLRFRRAHQQVVRYIPDAGQAAVIRAELARLQTDRHLQRELERLTKGARLMLRESKRSLEPIVATEGLKFHGLSLRRPRKRKTSQ
jgi:hypothetical protein